MTRRALTDGFEHHAESLKGQALKRRGVLNEGIATAHGLGISVLGLVKQQRTREHRLPRGEGEIIERDSGSLDRVGTGQHSIQRAEHEQRALDWRMGT